MAAISSNGTGGGDWSAGASWGGGVKPVAGDTVTILNGDVITCDSTEACATITINAGGELVLELSTCILTTTGNITQNGKLTINGSGDTGNPVTWNMGGTLTAGANSEYDMVASAYDSVTAGTSDILINGTGGARMNGANLSSITGTIKGLRFTGAWSSFCFYSWRNFQANYETFSIEDLIFDALSDYSAHSCSLHDIGNWLDKDSTFGTAPIYNCKLSGTGKVKVVDAATSAAFYLDSLKDDIEIEHQNSNDASVYRCRDVVIAGSAKLSLTETINNAQPVFYQGAIIDNGQIDITPQRTGVIYIFSTCTIDTDGAIVIDVTNVTGATYLFFDTRIARANNVQITLNATALYLLRNDAFSYTWIMSRSRIQKFVGHSLVAITNTADSGLQYEPIAYDAHAADNLMTIQHDLVDDCPNYSDLYGDSTGWTSSTKTLADNGELIADTSGWHNTPTSGKTGMDVGILDLSAIATTITGTLSGSEVIRYQISFDGGVIWSAELTEAQLQSNSWTINGEPYTPDASRNCQLRIIIKNTTGSAKTVTSVTTTGIKFDPDAVEQTIEERLIELQGEMDTVVDKLCDPSGVSANIIAVQGVTVTDIDDFKGEGGGTAEVDLTEVLRKIRYNRTEIEKTRDLLKKGLDTVETALIKNEIGGPHGGNNAGGREHLHRNRSGQRPFQRLVDELKPREFDAKISDES